MTAHLPFEPIDAYESLQQLLPAFSLRLLRLDLQSYIVNGYVARRFILRGRFAEFSHTRPMRSPEELTIESFLNNTIPRESVEPLYNGDAIGFVIEGKHRLYMRGDKLSLTEFQNDERLVFVYQRPSTWQPVKLAKDLFYNTLYDDGFERVDVTSAMETEKEISIFQFLNTAKDTHSFLIESFAEAARRKSRFGFTPASFRAMIGNSLMHRIGGNYQESERILVEAQALAKSALSSDVELQLEIIYNLGGIYLDQGATSDAETNYMLVEKGLRQHDSRRPSILYLKGLEGLAAAALQNGLLQRAEAFLLQVLDVRNGILDKEWLDSLATKNTLGTIYRAQGFLERAHSICEETFQLQLEHLGRSHHQTLRTLHNLASALFEQGLLLESKALYTQELHDLELVVGAENSDSLLIMELLAHLNSELLNFSDAIADWRKLSGVYTRIFGKEHPKTMEAQYQLARSLWMDSQFDESIEGLENLRTRNENFYGHLHSITRRTMNLLASLYHRNGNSLKSKLLRQDMSNTIEKAHVGKEQLSQFATRSSPLGNLDDRLNAHLQRRLSGTCSWIFEDEVYKSWLSSPPPSILWIRGLPGTGKTTLASAIIENLQESHQETIFFFFDSGDHSLSNAEGLLTSLITQMERIRPSIVSRASHALANQPVTPFSRLFQKFSELAMGFGELNCCIDAIEQCDGSKNQLLRNMSSMLRSGSSPIKFILTSRPYVELSDSFADAAHVIDLPSKGTEGDVREMISAHHEKTLLDNKWKERILEMANGSFLWVELAMSNIERNGISLDKLTKSLEEEYRSSLLSLTANFSIPDAELLCNILYWVKTAFRPLTVAELQLALAVEPSDKRLEELKILSAPSESIMRVGGPLLRLLPGDIIAPVHQSLIDFLHSAEAPRIQFPSQISIPIISEKANAHLASICITYLSFDSFLSPYNSVSKSNYKFLDYAASYWYRHALLTGNSISMFNSVSEFLNSGQAFNWLDGLQTFFGKSAEDMLVIQSHICSWAQRVEKANMSKVAAFVLRLYRRKIEAIEKHSSFTTESLPILVRLADICRATGNLEEAERLYERSLGVATASSGVGKSVKSLLIQNRSSEIYNHDIEGRKPDVANLDTDLLLSHLNILDKDYPITLVSMRNLASTYRNQGRWKEAESIEVRVLEATNKFLGHDHPDTLISMANLASTYRIQGKLKEAEELHIKVMEMSRMVLGDDHKQTLSAMANLASTYEYQGRYKEAQELYVHALENQQTQLGSEHPETMRTMQDLATVYYSQGDYEAAESTSQKVLQSREEVLGPEHPDTLESMNTLAEVLESQGRYTAAESMHQQVLEVTQRVLGKKHPSTLASMNNLAVVYQRLGKYRRAEEVHMELLDRGREFLGMEHPSILTSMTNLAAVYQTQGKYDKAEKMEVEVLRLREKTLGSSHPSTIQVANNLGVLYKEQGRLKEAEIVYKRALDGYERALGADHPSTLNTVNNLGRLFAEQGQLAEAEALYKRALEGQEKALGPEHTSTLNTVNNLGCLFAEQGRLAEAEALYKRALEGQEKALGPEHTSTLNTVYNLGHLFAEQGQLAEAEALYKRALDGQEKAWGPEHMSTLDTMNSLGRLFAEQGRLAEAEALYNRALAGYKKVLGAEHKSTLDTFNHLDRIYAEQRRLKEAEEMNEQALEGERKRSAHMTMHGTKDLIRDFEYKCDLCYKQLNFYNARQCSYCGGKGAMDDPFYCITCTVESCMTVYCREHETCWDDHLPKIPKLAQLHQIVDPLSQLFVDVITYSEVNPERQKRMHQRDKQARWFNMRRDTIGQPDLYIYDRFIQLCDPSRSGNIATKHHYPSFVSFVGDTSVGKSTLVRAMLGIGNTSQFLPSENGRISPDNDGVMLDLVTAIENMANDGPVTRSGNINHLTDPTTLGVHLYLDKGITMGSNELGPETDAQYPILFADCEGFGASKAMTNAERMESDILDNKEFQNSRDRSPSRQKDLTVQLPVTASCYGSRGKDGVDLFYARFLYAISDVIVFVTKEDQMIQTELTRVLEWVSEAVHKSVNHPSRKTLIIVRNMASFHEAALYEAEKLRYLYLDSHAEPLWEDSPILRQFVDKYNNQPEITHRYDLQITSNDRLYKALFKNITCCYIPNKFNVKGKPQDLWKQYRGLRDLMESSVRDGLSLRAKSFMQYNVPMLSHILTQAFMHFTTSENPFDFYLAARRDNPNPILMQDHIANFLRHTFESRGDIETVDYMVSEVTSVALLVHTYRNFWEAPSPAEIFNRNLYEICSSSIEIYLKQYEKCAFRFRDGQACTSRPAEFHHQHTSAKGEFQPGPFEHQREWTSAYKEEWIRGVQRRFSGPYETIFLANGNTDRPVSLEKRLTFKRGLSRSSHYNIWKSTKSNKTCFSCLQAVPDHVLGCGHSYCPRCVQELGNPSSSSECAWDMRCWLCWEDKGRLPHQIQLKPRCAGTRILTLDGGGIRAIIELSVLQALHNAVGLDLLPMKNMFDLIVGTSTGGIIALALVMSNCSIPMMVEFFSAVSKKTFSQTTAGRISKFGPLKKITTYGLMVLRITESVFGSEALKGELKSFFKNDTNLFGPALQSQPSTTRVAVTSAKDLGETTCLITNYNHPLGNFANNLEREEDAEKDMKVWEAALATSAAPFYLPIFEKKETRTQYIDGAVYANCPAQIAYEEKGKIWPDNGASLDFLISLGTGVQKAKDNEIPSLVNLDFFVPIRAMFHRQLDSKRSWVNFEQQTAPANSRSRLYRLNPPLKGDYVDLYDYKKMPELVHSVAEWTKNDGNARIQEIADTLIANLFFFEPDDDETTNTLVSRQSHLSNASHDILAGSVRCRLSHESPQLLKLLDKMVEGFFYTQTASDNTDVVGYAQNWTEIEHPQRHRRPIDMMVAESGQKGQVVQKFRLPFRFAVKKQSNVFQVLAVKLKRSEKKIVISGFPSTLADLLRRSEMKWLQ